MPTIDSAALQNRGMNLGRQGKQGVQEKQGERFSGIAKSSLDSAMPILLLTLIFGLILGIDDCSSIAAQQVEQPRLIDPVNSHQTQVVQPPVTGLVSTLSDEVKELPEELIRWSTYWQLCWEPYPEAKEYELQKVLVEGKSPKLQRHSDRCFRIQAASNENQKSQGLLNRDLILLVHKTQLGYRVRAV